MIASILNLVKLTWGGFQWSRRSTWYHFCVNFFTFVLSFDVQIILPHSRFNIDDSVSSKQLPTLILFQNGKEVKRRPVKSTGRDEKVFLFHFTKVL